MERRVHLAPEHPAVLLVRDLVERPLEDVELHLIEAADGLLEQLERLRESLGREVLIEEHLIGAEDRVRELPEREARDARPHVEALAGGESEVAPVEVEVLTVEVAGQVLVGGDRVVDVAAGAANGGRQLVAERETDAEARADTLAVACGGVRADQVGLVVEALVTEPDVAEDRGAADPIRQAHRLLGGLGARGLGRFRRLGRLLDLLLGSLADRPLLLHLVLERLELFLGAAERLFEPPDALLGRRLRARRTRQQDRRHRHRQQPRSGNP